MKKTLFCLCLILYSCFAFAQLNGNYNYSFGLRGYGVIQFPKILDQYNSQSYTSTYFNGGMIKFNDNQIAYRISGNYIHKKMIFPNNCKQCEEAAGNLTDYSVKIGFEKNFNYSRIQPYFGLDAGFRTNKFTGILSNINPQKAPDSRNVETTKDGITASPFAGIKINPIKEISFFIEGNIELFYSYERQELTSLDATNKRQFNRYHRAEFLLSPVSIGIQLHVGSKN